MMPARHVRQPGPPTAERVIAVEAGAVPVDRMLPAGARLLDALAALVAEAGGESACLSLSGGCFGPFGYVIPAVAPDPSHAAFYSATRTPAGLSALAAASVTVGWRAGAPVFHCHALWAEADGRRGCGHVLPAETWVATPVRARGGVLVGARFEVMPDPETGFDLFQPRPTGTSWPPGAGPALALRLAPNQDLVAALQAAGRGAGFGRARIEGGVASTIGARFTDGTGVEGFATELLVRRGEIACQGAEAPGEVEIAIVDLHGTIAEGVLAPGENPVLMTFEGALLPA